MMDASQFLEEDVKFVAAQSQKQLLLLSFGITHCPVSGAWHLSAAIYTNTLDWTECKTRYNVVLVQ